MLPLLLLLATQTPNAWVPNAKLGTPYLIGYKAFVSGSKEQLDTGSERWLTLNSVRTDLVFATKNETYVAGEGQKLVILNCTIKNPSKLKVTIHRSETFYTRVFDPGAKAGDYEVLGAVHESLAPLSHEIKTGQSVDLYYILRAPATSKTLRLGFYYAQHGRSNTRRYDLTEAVKGADSIFATSPLTYVGSATAKVGQEFDYELLKVKVLGIHPVERGVAVKVQFVNRTLTPAKWGWQYASATLQTTSGKSISFYPDLVDNATGKPWSGDLAPGATLIGEYRFYDDARIDAKSLTLQMTATKRTVVVSL